MQKVSVTVPEATERTGIQHLHLHAFQHGKLTPRKLGKRTPILVEELDALVKSLPVGGSVRDARKRSPAARAGAPSWKRQIRGRGN